MAPLFSPDENNVFGYLARSFETLDERPLTDVDSLVLACLSYYHYQGDAVRSREGAPVRDLFRAEWAEAMTHGLWDPDGLARLLALVAASPRFRDLRVSDYVDDFDEAAEKQFSACVLRLPGGGAYVSFRGTDNTLVGWKEDFNMAFAEEVPAQREAARYLEQAAALGAPMRVGGHSKGGNLAVYAAARASGAAQARVSLVMNFDGPGLSPAVIDSAGYRAVEPRIETWLPEASIVGILLERSPRYRVVRSSAAGPLQHDPYTWQTTPDGFETVAALSGASLYADRTIREWLDSMSLADREAFVEALYGVVGATGARTLDEISENWRRSGWQMLGALGGLDLRTKSMLFLSLGKLILSAVRNLSPAPANG